MEGSKTVTTEVILTNLLAQMKDHTYYMGEAMKSDSRLIELGAKLQASDDDDTVLMDFVNNGISKVANLLTRVLGITTYKVDTNSTKKVTFTTKAVANFPQDQSDTLKGNISSYLSCLSLFEWLQLIKPDEAPRFKEKSEQLEVEIMNLSAQRSKPTRAGIGG